MTSTNRILLTGATGYIGGRLLPALEALGRPLRCLARRPDALRDRVAPQTEIVGGDLLDAGSLDRAMAGVHTAYYLVHSMGAHGDYREADLLAARAFGGAARRAGVCRIIYLGGLAHDDGSLSKHLKSRLETGEALRESGVPVVERGLRRLMISVPLLTPHLSSLWLGIVTPIYARIGRQLIEGLRNRSVVQDHGADAVFDVRPVGLADAVSRAIRNEDRDFALTRWSDALQSGGGPRPLVSARFGSRLVDARTRHVDVPPARAFLPIARIGGRRGWYYGTWMWRLRGYADLLLGGVGMRRGRRDPERVVVGDALDFWRIDAWEPGRRLRLAAEMKVPGRAWLEFEVVPDDSGATIHQTAVFDPIGLWGLLYWYSLVPVHGLTFGGMLREIARQATLPIPPIPTASA